METPTPTLDYHRPPSKILHLYFAWRPALLAFVILAIVVSSIWCLEQFSTNLQSWYWTGQDCIYPWPTQFWNWLSLKLSRTHYWWTYLGIIPIGFGVLIARFRKKSQLQHPPQLQWRTPLLGFLALVIAWITFVASALLGPAWNHHQWTKTLPKEPTDQVSFNIDGVYWIMANNKNFKTVNHSYFFDIAHNSTDITFDIPGQGILHVFFMSNEHPVPTEWSPLNLFLEKSNGDYYYVGNGSPGEKVAFDQKTKRLYTYGTFYHDLIVTMQGSTTFPYDGEIAEYEWTGHIFRQINYGYAKFDPQSHDWKEGRSTKK